jgi:dihydrofolate synthase/folylpolyglutamate synthase
MLKASGKSTGLYVSPHVVTPRERISVDGELISPEDFASAVLSVRRAIELSRAKAEWTYFEVLTAAAILYFARAGVEWGVFEVGMGGRLDATNVLDPAAAVITSISYDHTEVLGQDIVSIAREKAAIIKENMYCVSAPQAKDVMEVIKARCLEKNTELRVVGRDVRLCVERLDDHGALFDVRTQVRTYLGVKISMGGDFQPVNCAVAITACEAVLRDEFTKEAVVKGAFSAYLPGRFEIIGRAPLVVIDAAHNEASVLGLAGSVKKIFSGRRVVLIAGFCKDKDMRAIAPVLMSMADEIILTRAAGLERAADPFILRGFFRGGNVAVAADTREALGIALSRASSNDLIIATGSFHIIGEVRRMIVGEE